MAYQLVWGYLKRRGKRIMFLVRSYLLLFFGVVISKDVFFTRVSIEYNLFFLSFNSIWLIKGALISTTRPVQREPWSNIIEEVLHTQRFPEREPCQKIQLSVGSILGSITPLQRILSTYAKVLRPTFLPLNLYSSLIIAFIIIAISYKLFTL